MDSFPIGIPEIVVIIGIIAMILVMVLPAAKICDRVGFPPWYAMFAVLPIANVILLWYVAFAPWPRVDKRQTA